MENKPIRRRNDGNEEAEKRSWSDMPTDILLQIFAFLSVVDRIFNVSMVCRSWYSACSNKIIWNSLDLCEIKHQLISSQNFVAKPQLQVIFKLVINLGGENLTTLIIDPMLEVDDEHLIYAAERCPNLKQLGLPSLKGTTNLGLRTAFSHWTNLESMFVSFGSCFPYLHIFKIIGENCPNFTELKLSVSCVDKKTASAITKSLPNLKVLSVRSFLFKKEAAITLLNVLMDLDKLYISICKLINNNDGSVFPPPIMYDQRVLQRASRLQIYHTCFTGECNIACPASTMGPPLLHPFEW
ncbi:hypothetical protein ACH5RR_041530 [Cinchona calisaya]|uniref:F-box domain-containing protein n=1 Tax=Cinchona calisaya TaxID=153742 RepID=A0ABD2XZ91_9GENT